MTFVKSFTDIQIFLKQVERIKIFLNQHSKISEIEIKLSLKF